MLGRVAIWRPGHFGDLGGCRPAGGRQHEPTNWDQLGPTAGDQQSRDKQINLRPLGETRLTSSVTSQLRNIHSKQHQRHKQVWVLVKQSKKEIGCCGMHCGLIKGSKKPISRLPACTSLSLSDQSDLEEVVAARAHESDILPLFWCLLWPP